MWPLSFRNRARHISINSGNDNRSSLKRRQNKKNKEQRLNNEWVMFCRLRVDYFRWTDANPRIKTKTTWQYIYLLLLLLLITKAETKPKQFVSEQLNCYNDAIIAIEIEANCALNQLNFGRKKKRKIAQYTHDSQCRQISETKNALRFLTNSIIIDITTQIKNYSKKSLTPLWLLDIFTNTKTTTTSTTTTETGAKRNSYVWQFNFRKSETKKINEILPTKLWNWNLPVFIERREAHVHVQQSFIINWNFPIGLNPIGCVKHFFVFC